MIFLTKIDGREIIVNSDEIETCETSHDTIISLKSGKKILVSEKSTEIRDKVIKYKQECFCNLINVEQKEA